MLKHFVCILSITFGCITVSSQESSEKKLTKKEQERKSRRDNLYRAAKTGQSIHAWNVLFGMRDKETLDVLNEPYDSNGFTPFLTSIVHLQYSMAIYFLDKGANANAQDKVNGRSALHHLAHVASGRPYSDCWENDRGPDDFSPARIVKFAAELVSGYPIDKNLKDRYGETAYDLYLKQHANIKLEEKLNAQWVAILR